MPDGLQHLWLETNQIRRIENLPDTLQSLGLSENQIRQIENLPISLTSLELSKNPTINIPSEILGNHVRDNHLSDVRGWFADLAVGQVKNNTVRLMVTGNGNVGKSSLITALQQGRCAEDKPSTHGIRVDLVTIRDEEGQPVIMQVFDFGGQELYHGTHSLFMRARAVQLLVFDTETETTAQTPDRITGETVRNQPLAYWADQITQLSPNSPVVLVQNKLDRPMNRPPEIVATLAEFETEGVTVAGVSATTGKGIPGLRGHLLEAAQQLPELGMAIPMSWHNVRQFFLDNIQRPLASRRRLMTPAEFTDLCRRENVLPNSDNALLRYLHNTGAVYADSKYLPDTIIADQQWAIEGIYKALDRCGDLYELLRNLSFGKCELQLILSAFGTEYTDEQCQLFFNLMQSCGLCFRLQNEQELPVVTRWRLWPLSRRKDRNSETEPSKQYFVFPEFLPAKRPESVETWLKKAGKDLCIWQQQVPFLPYTHVQEQIARWGTRADIRNIWRTGFYVTTPEGTFVLEANLTTQTLWIRAESTLLYTDTLQDLLRITYRNGNWVRQKN